MRKRLIILSDLWGKEKSEWLINYTQILGEYFDITFYDSCELGAIDKSDYSENHLHKQFISGGIEKAVESLILIEKEKATILAFSIGGTIAWQFGLKSEKIDRLFCVSSTRLRHEKLRPKGAITLYFGSKDNYKPDINWLDRMKLNSHILDNKEHQFYREPEDAEYICKQIIASIKGDSAMPI
jgi:hypothetical protein